MPDTIEDAFVSVYATSNPAMAGFVQSILDDAGIEYFMNGDLAQAVWAQALVQFSVRTKDAAEAKELLRDVKEGV